MNDCDAAERLGTLLVSAVGGELARALLRELALGAPVTPGRLAERLAWPPEQVAALLSSLPNVERDAAGRVIAFGLSLRETPHVFEVGRQHLPAAMVSVVFPDSFDRQTFCDQVSFFSSAGAAEPWLANYPGAALVSVDEAWRTARDLVPRLIAGDGARVQPVSGAPCVA